jgi:hypothetical protein
MKFPVFHFLSSVESAAALVGPTARRPFHKPKTSNRRSAVADQKPETKNRQAAKGAAIISVLLVLTVLTIMVVAFLQSMRIDRLTARAYLNKTKAEMAADGGTDVAMDRLKRLMLQKPYFAIGYEAHASEIIPVFFGSIDGNSAPTSTYLISTDTPEVAPTAFSSTDSTELNFKIGPNEYWMGSPVVDGTALNAPAKAYWINVLQNPSLPNQPDPGAGNYNPIIARYAFWIEDETAKLDFNTIGNKDGPSGSFLRSATGNVLSDLDIGALPLVGKLPLGTGQEAINKRFFDARGMLPTHPHDTGLINRFTYPDGSADIRSDVKFHTTPFSLSNELSGAAQRRINLNNLITNVSPATPNADKIIAADLDDIVFAISGKHPFTGLNNNTHQGLMLDKPTEIGLLKDFGKRFYTTPAFPTPLATLKDNHELTYLLRLAANIRDYIDTDQLPTFVDYTGSTKYGTRPSFSWTTGQEPVALGKESVPYLQEHAFHAVQTQYDIVPNVTGQPTNRRRISFYLDHYFEFYNPSNKDFVAPAGTELRIYNRFSFGNNTASAPIVLPDITLNLAGTSFPAGQAVVITTCPAPAQDPTGLLLSANVVRVSIPGSSRTFGPFLANETVGSPTRYGTQVLGRTSATTDYKTEMLFSTPQGVLDAHPFIALTADFSMTRAGDTNDLTRFTFATNLRGNDAISRAGDPRSLSEPMALNAGSNTAYGNDQARFFGSITGGGTTTVSVPGTSSYGIPANTTFVNPTNWPDYHVALSNSANNSYAVINDGIMQGIGELGNIYDPHRKLSPESAATIRSARGGARTLKIGQPDDLMGIVRFSPSSSTSVGWFNAAWRLLDVFSADPATIVLSPATSRGKLNINGVLRDKGVAFRALLRSFIFAATPLGDPARAGKTLSNNEINTLVSQVEDYLDNNGPMMERGELSQIAFFSSGTAGQSASSTAYDRSREEIFRRIADLITTRSSSYSVYCVGQAIQQLPNGKILRVASSRKKTSFTITPTIGDNPMDKPTDYVVDIYATLQE